VSWREYDTSGSRSEERASGADCRSGRPPDFFPGSSIAYSRWFWATLEAIKGQLRRDILDSALAESRAQGQSLAIRQMPYDERQPVPEWYRTSGARRANKATGTAGALQAAFSGEMATASAPEPATSWFVG
jgi:hypothetical protein